MSRQRSCFRQFQGGKESLVRGTRPTTEKKRLRDRDEFRSRKLGKYSKSRFKSFTLPRHRAGQVGLSSAARGSSALMAQSIGGVLYGEDESRLLCTHGSRPLVRDRAPRFQRDLLMWNFWWAFAESCETAFATDTDFLHVRVESRESIEKFHRMHKNWHSSKWWREFGMANDYLPLK